MNIFSILTIQIMLLNGIIVKTENFREDQILLGKGMQGCVTLVAFAASKTAMENYNRNVRGIASGQCPLPHPIRIFDPPEKKKYKRRFPCEIPMLTFLLYLIYFLDIFMH